MRAKLYDSVMTAPGSTVVDGLSRNPFEYLYSYNNNKILILILLIIPVALLNAKT